MDQDSGHVKRSRRAGESSRRLRAVESQPVHIVPSVGESSTIGRLIARTALLADSAVTRHERELPKARSRWGRWR